MQPWRHAYLSANKFNGNWHDYLVLHEFIDSAKPACPDLRHRIVLHNSDLGIALANFRFPDMPNVTAIAEAHIRQDIGQFPRLIDWLETAKSPTRLREKPIKKSELILQVADKLGINSPEAIREVYDLLTLGERYCGDKREFGKVILMNSFGPHLIRTIIGPAYEIDGKIFDPSWVAEGIIVAHFGLIPTLSDVLKPFSGNL